MNKLLFIFPSVANNPEITKAISIFNGIAKRKSWQTDYFDTYVYEKTDKSIASVKERANTGEVKIFTNIDSELKPRQELARDLQNKINTFKPNIIAISCSSYEYEHLLTFWPEIKIPDDTLVIIGGVHCVLKPNQVISTNLFNMVCVGDGEETFEELLTKYDSKEDLRNIKNIYYRDKSSNEIIKNPRRNLTDESVLWKFVPDYSLFHDKYFIYPFHGKLYRRFRFEVGRGCPYDCAYCANSALKKVFHGLGKYYRARPLEDMKFDMEVLLNKYNIEMFLLDDECLLAHSTEWLNDFFSWYGEKAQKPFILQTRPETITEEKIQILEKSNAPFFLVKMGIESGSERILKDVCNRMTKIEQIEKAYEILRGHDKIISSGCFMIGLPYETREDIFKTINLCRKVKPDEMLVNIFQPLPGQKLKEVCIKEGYMNEDDKLCFFTDSSILKMPQISCEEITNLRRVFPLYATLPEKYFDKIELCEKDFNNNQELYKELVDLRWSIGKN
ncbi:B12-binding domain-containing radical SAM protein [Candidatus Parcubacteria bacterium]|nr:B12-binding domain-containing radical SAM protein [Candidatus Parcubacteria bacterium]